MQTAQFCKKIKHYEETIKNLTIQLTKLQNNYNTLKEQYNRLNTVNNDLLHALDRMETDQPLTYLFIKTTIQNFSRNLNGKRYDGLKHFFTLLSLTSKHTIDILNAILCAPTYRSVLTYRTSIENEYMLGDDVFNGKQDNLTTLFDLFHLPLGSTVTLMIDACMVDPYLSIDTNGHIIGLMNTEEVLIEDVNEIIQNEDSFMNFLVLHSNKLVKAEFVINMATIDGTLPILPICCIPANSGSATGEIIQRIESIVKTLKELGLNVVSLGTDGDPQYNKYSRVVIDAIFNDFDEFLNEDLSQTFKKFDTIIHFSDPLHIAKRDRYRKVKYNKYHTHPVKHNYNINISQLLDVGFPQYIVDNSQARKMEDCLPERFFSGEMLTKLMHNDMIPAVITFLPSHLMLESIMSQYYTRTQRIDQLLLGSMIALIYYICGTVLWPKSSQRGMIRKAFNDTWLVDYISTCLGIAYLLNEEETVYLGACGTHPLEHLFGNIRRLSAGKDTHKYFMRSLKTFVIESILKESCGLQSLKLTTRKDSGVIVCDNDFFNEIILKEWFMKALALINMFTVLPRDTEYISTYWHDNTMCYEELEGIIKTNNDKLKRSKTTKNTGITKTGGLSMIRKWKAATQIKELYE